ncbi:MAG: hypothetical protein PHH59_05645 [Methylovulum sp.]|uniref:hypothetical protein n=1 Tax=Methylovulum sp. TaxID=1916980 RepID=UPI00262AC620|nr:hypothetical protein [Methylovulum sp.]MDD2723495.1 hypothetical protein [Methylovulum sp.]MDD5124537.1 hypothetical protein [Methylovulum sp.]
MDKRQLESELETFKQACIAEGCIRADNEYGFEFEETYPGIFIINVNATKNWLNDKYHVSALNDLIGLLYRTTELETRESILTLRLCQEDEFNRVSYDTLPPQKAA